MRGIPASASMQLSADAETSTIVRRNPRNSDKNAENKILINTRQSEENPVLGSLRHVRLRHAKELLSVEPKKFVYSGAVSDKEAYLV